MPIFARNARHRPEFVVFVPESTGTPEAVAKTKGSHTGRFLKIVLG